MGGRFTDDPGRDSQRYGSRFLCGCCGYARCYPVGGDAPGAPTGTGATPRSEGLVRARGRVRFHTRAPALLGSLPIQESLGGKAIERRSGRGGQRSGPASGPQLSPAGSRVCGPRPSTMATRATGRRAGGRRGARTPYGLRGTSIPRHDRTVTPSPRAHARAVGTLPPNAVECQPPHGKGCPLRPAGSRGHSRL